MRRKISIIVYGTLICLLLLLIGSGITIFIHSEEYKQPAAIEQLRALPYAVWGDEGVESDKSGVVKYDHTKAFSGYSLYNDLEGNVHLIDMEGHEVHKWYHPLIVADGHTELLDNGEILVIFENSSLAKLDRYSNVLWRRNIRAHHDIGMAATDICAVPVSDLIRLYNLRLVRFDSLLFLSSSGKLIDKWSTFKCLGELKKFHSPSHLELLPHDSMAISCLKKIYFSIRKLYFILRMKEDKINSADSASRGISKQPSHYYHPSLLMNVDEFIRKKIALGAIYDYYHLNTVKVLPRNKLGKRDGRFRKGNYLVCLRNANTILVLDKQTKEIVWNWGSDVLDWPHMPTMTEEGTVLIFDNGAHRGYSRVLEIEPISGNIIWEYQGKPKRSFYSRLSSGAQRLPNGNTLICESARGHVFEVTNDGKIVWEFYNPEIKDGKRKTIYRMLRFPKEKVEKWIVFNSRS